MQDIVIIHTETLTGEQIADARALLALVNAHEGLDLKLDIPAPVIESIGYFLIYDESNRLLAFASVEGRYHREACGMVHPEARRRGLGRALLRDIVDLCRVQGAEDLLVICEDASPGGLALVRAWGARRSFVEWRMELAEIIEQPAKGPPISLLLATSGDLQAIAQIQASAFGNRSAEDAMRNILYEVDTPENRYYIGRLDGEVVGTLKVFFSDDRALIYAFAVAPERQHQGIGRQIMLAVIHELRAQGWQHIGLEVDDTNTRAAALYRSMGFVTRTIYGYYDVMA